MTPIVENPVALSTVTNPAYYDVTQVEIYLEPSQGRPYDPLFDYTGLNHAYYFGLTYSWPESCNKNHGAFTTDIPIPVPLEAGEGLTPISIVPVGYRHPECYPVPTANLYLDPTDVPAHFVSVARDHIAP